MMRMVLNSLLSCMMTYATWQVCFLLVQKQNREDAERIAFCMRKAGNLLGIMIGAYVGGFMCRSNDLLSATKICKEEPLWFGDIWSDHLFCAGNALSLACMTFAVVSDFTMKYAYRFCWYGVYAVCGLLGMRSFLSELGVELGIFFFLQFLWFRRFYGRADCHGFFAGACILFLHGGNLWDYVMQMAYAFGLLFVIQLFRKNINRRGNLKEPVAFLPYVAAGLLLRLSCLKMIV